MTDRRTDGPTDRMTDRVGHRVACTRLIHILHSDGECVELLVEGLKRGLAINETLPSDAGNVECILENGTKTSCVLFVEGMRRSVCVRALSILLITFCARWYLHLFQTLPWND